MKSGREVLREQKNFFLVGKTRRAGVKEQALERLADSIKRHEAEICRSLAEDLGKSKAEAYMTEIGLVYDEIRYMKKHLRTWQKGKKVSGGVSVFPGKALEYREPFGSVLILAPWNYPFLLCMLPLVGAISAGNCAVVKPSELAPASAAVIAAVVKEALPEKYAAVFTGGAEVSQSLLKEPFDFIFYTGGRRVAEKVMEAAAKNLTPVCLELGGKSPCLVDDTADLKMTARRIINGKMMNGGQTCVAPDYILADVSIKAELEKWLVYYAKKYAVKGKAVPKYAHIVNERHKARLQRLLQGQKLLCGGTWNGLYLSPAIVDSPAEDSALMQEEIFGPILPVIGVDGWREAVRYVQKGDKPLALYYFGNNAMHAAEVRCCVSFGGGCINDTLLQSASHGMAFGGVGKSGMGSYHGEHSYRLFTHAKSVLIQSQKIENPLRYHLEFPGVYGLLKKVLK